MIRVEKNKLFFINQEKSLIYIVEKEKYKYLLSYIINNSRNSIINDIESIELIDELNQREQILQYMNDSLKIDLPENSLTAPLTINMEVTTKCPLKCSQCYCHSNKAKYIDKNKAMERINEAGRLKVPFISFSGGETLEYKYITDLIRCCKNNNIHSAIAISGVEFNESVLEKLINSGINSIYVSLNGSSKEVNSMSRDGYEFAVRALEILKRSSFNNYYINWVAHNYNISDFKNMINLAERYQVKKIIVLALKPNSKYELRGAPNYENFIRLSEYIEKFSCEALKIEIESCYSPLKSYLNNGKSKGNILDICGAGKTTMSISVDNNMSPCRHLEIYDNLDSIENYWRCSPTINKLRNCYNREKCKKCKYSDNCLPCTAINYKINNKLFGSNEYCPLNKSIM